MNLCGEILPNLTPGCLLMLGLSAAKKFIYGRPVGGPEDIYSWHILGSEKDHFNKR